MAAKNQPCKTISFKSDSDTTGLPYRELTAAEKVARKNATAKASNGPNGGRKCDAWSR